MTKGLKNWIILNRLIERDDKDYKLMDKINLYEDEEILHTKYHMPNLKQNLKMQVTNAQDTQSMAYTLNYSLGSYHFQNIGQIINFDGHISHLEKIQVPVIKELEKYVIILRIADIWTWKRIQAIADDVKYSENILIFF
jgi:hypothetical protein